MEAAWGQSFFNHFCQRKSLWQLNIVSFRDNIVAYLIYLTANIFCLLFCILYRLLVLMSLQKQNLNHWAYYQLFIVTLHLFFLFYWNTDHSVYTCQLFGAFEEAISAKEETHWLGPVSISQLAPLYILCITVSIALKVTHTGNNFWKPFLEKTCQADGLWGGSIKWYCILNVSIL